MMAISKNNKNKIFTLIFLYLLISLIILNAFPALFKGVDNLRMIRHFNSDEAEIVGFYNDSYKKIFSTPPAIVSYPTLFYYTAGIFFFPYSYLNKDRDNHTVIVVSFRILNTVSIILTTILIYFLSLKFLKSKLFSLLLLLLILTSPGYLYWGLNSRPHPFEILFLFISIAFGLNWIEHRKKDYLFKCLFFAALAFATKYGGIFIIPSLFVLIIYFFLHEHNKPLDIIKRYNSMIYTFSFLVIAFGLASLGLLYFFLIPLLAKITKIGSNLGVVGLMSLKLFQFITIGLIFISISGCIWFLLNLYSGRIIDRHKRETLSFNRIDIFILLTNFSFLFLFLVVLLFGITFLITNPHCIVHPIATARACFGLGLIEFSFSTQGEGIIREWINNLVWFKMLFEKHTLGVSGIFLLIWYFLFEIINWKRNWLSEKNKILQRIFICLLIVTNFVFLFVFIKFRTPHYLLMITFLLLFLILIGIERTFQLVAGRNFKIFLAILFIFLISWNFFERMPLFFHYYRFVNTKDMDSGLFIGKWLEEKFNENTIIWSDTKEFYVPPKFTNFHSKWWHEDINNHLESIKSINPDILIVSGVFEYTPDSAEKINHAVRNGVLKNFRQIKVFDYQGPLALKKGRIGLYKSVYIYENQAK